ncbi:MAG: siroheme synthase [Rhodobacteraceae bacterium]|nr:siroheme synthase [Paracoccaceae bacterium]
MKHFPIFLNLQDRKVVVAGGSEPAVAKLRLLLKTEADIVVFSDAPHEAIAQWAAQNRLTHFARPAQSGDLSGAALLYCAQEDARADAQTATLGRKAGALVNIVDNLQDSAFVTPAIVDRSPVTVAIGTEGAAPVLARKIKAGIEELLPTSLGRLAQIGQAFRPTAKALATGRARRDFWSQFFFNHGPRALAKGGETAASETLSDLLDDALQNRQPHGIVHLIGTGPGDPELLTLKARNLLHQADLVIHDGQISAGILDLARREAMVLGATHSQAAKAGIHHADNGLQVARLLYGSPVRSVLLEQEIAALEAAGIDWALVPGAPATPATLNLVSENPTLNAKAA